MSLDLTATARRLLLSRIRTVMIGVGSVAALLVLGTRLVDEGEIVELSTRDAKGREQMTELWVVDLPSGTWLRAGSPDVRWLARLRSTPEVVLERGEAKRHYRAVPDEAADLRDQINRAMREKYGAMDRLWGRLSDRRLTIPVRLVPSEAVAAGP